MPDTVYNRPLIDSELNRMYREATLGARSGRRVAAVRRAAAYVLKFVAAGAGLAISFNKWPDLHQDLAIASVVAVFLDTISQNYKRLVATIKAGDAYFFLHKKVQGTYNVAAGLVDEGERIKNGGIHPATNSQDYENAILALKKAAAEELRTQLEVIGKAKADEDLKLLETLSLDAERAARQVPSAREA